MVRQPITIQNKLGLHTRAAAKLVGTAQKFASRIELTFRGHTVDAKGIMGVITLGAQKDHEIEVVVKGDDEQQALEAIVSLVNNKFGED